MASELRVDRIIPVNGVPTGGGGGLIQVVSTAKTDDYSISVAAGSKSTSNVTGLEASITPKFSSSKILVMVDIHTSTEDNGTFITLRRGSTEIGIGDVAGSRQRVSTVASADGTTANNYIQIHTHMTFLDSPSSTSALTYGVVLSHTSSITRTIYVNRSHTNTDANSAARPISTITLMEVSG